MNEHQESNEIVQPKLPELDHLGQQMVNELRALLQNMNETYKDFYHFKLFNLIDLDPKECTACTEAEKQCLRCVISFSKMEK